MIVRFASLVARGGAHFDRHVKGGGTFADAWRRQPSRAGGMTTDENERVRVKGICTKSADKA